MKILEYCHDEDLVSFLKHRLVFLLCVFSFFASACDHDEKHGLKTFPTEFTEGDFNLDTIASDLVIIPLDFGEITVSQIMDVKWHQPYLYICSAEGTGVGRLSLFDLDGKMIKTMDRSGRGPGEYLSIQQFGVDDNGTIYINTWHKVVVYDRQLNHVRDTKWPDDLNFAEMYFHEDHIFLFSETAGKVPQYDWIILDTSGNVINTKPFNCYPEASYPPPFPLIILKSNNKLYRYRSIS
ncbi:MAG: BF3164 family lipoprotein, partial [Bacteroidales bacterium]